MWGSNWIDLLSRRASVTSLIFTVRTVEYSEVKGSHSTEDDTRSVEKRVAWDFWSCDGFFFCLSPSVSPFQLTAAKRVFIYANQTLHYVRVQRVRPGGPSTKFGKTSRGIGGNVFFIGLCTFRWKKYIDWQSESMPVSAILGLETIRGVRISPVPYIYLFSLLLFPFVKR